MNLAECVEFRRVDGVASDVVGAVVGIFQRRCEGVDAAACFAIQVGVFGDTFDVNVEGVDESPGGGQVGGVFDGWEGFCGVEGVDQQEVGVCVFGGDARKFREVVEVTDAPGLLAADGIQLRHHAAHGVFDVAVGGGKPTRGNHHVAAGGQGFDALIIGARRITRITVRVAFTAPVHRVQVERVPAERQVFGQNKGGFAPGDAVDGAGFRPVFYLLYGALAVVFKGEGDVGGGAVVNVNVDVVGVALDGHNAGGQWSRECLVVEMLDGCATAFFRGINVYVESSQGFQESIVANGDMVSICRPV